MNVKNEKYTFVRHLSPLLTDKFLQALLLGTLLLGVAAADFPFRLSSGSATYGTNRSSEPTSFAINAGLTGTSVIRSFSRAWLTDEMSISSVLWGTRTPQGNGANHALRASSGGPAVSGAGADGLT